MLGLSFQGSAPRAGPWAWPCCPAEPWGGQDGGLHRHLSLQALPPHNLPTSHRFYQLLTSLAMCVGGSQAHRMIPHSPPPPVRAFGISRRGSTPLLRLQARSARDARCFHSTPCGDSLPGFHMTASSTESHSREKNVAVLCVWVLRGSRVGWGGGGERRCNCRANQSDPLEKALNF